MTTRREFLALLSLAGLAGLAPRVAWSAPTLAASGKPQHVLIVGAGLAGLVSGYLLKQAGHRVTIVEARTRAGGRVLTAREPFADDLFGELGPARIPETHARMRAWVEHFGLALERFDPERGDRLDVVEGKKIRYRPEAPPDLDAYPLPFTAEERALGAQGVFERWLEPFQAFSTDFADKNWPPPGLAPFDAMTVRQYARHVGLSDAADRWIALGFADPDGLTESALWTYRILTLAAFNRPLTRLQGGMDLLPAAFAKRLAAEIRYGAPVVAMTQDTRGVTVVVEPGGSRTTLRADRAIVTAPFPPLRRVDFQPALSPLKRRAIRELRYSDLARVLLQLNARPWESQGLAGWAKTELPSEIWHVSFDRPGPRALMSLYLKESAAVELAKLEEPERLRYAVQHIEPVFPGIAAAVEGGISKAWSDDPWAGGAHAGLAPGQVMDFTQAVMAPEGRIHFAGEHTSAWQGWMEGALESGERAAGEINAGRNAASLRDAA